MKRPELCSLVLAEATSEAAPRSHLRSRQLRLDWNRNEVIAMRVREGLQVISAASYGLDGPKTTVDSSGRREANGLFT
jgi:hypothetical protein